MIGLIDQLLYEKESPHPVPASLFWRDEEFGLDELPFDLLIDESHAMRFDISDHAVENGAAVSDHVTRRLRSVTVTGLFTNHPSNGVDYAQKTSDGYELAQDEVDLESGELSAVTNRAQANWTQLQKIASEREPVTLYTALETYVNVVITELRASRGPQDGEAVKFTMTLREVRSVALSGTSVTATRDTGTEAGRATADKENVGMQPAQTVSSANNVYLSVDSTGAAVTE